MGFYQTWIVPPLTDLAMRNKDLRPYRERIVGAAEGRVLDVGIGSGLNLPFYGGRAGEIIGLDPSPSLLACARKRHGSAPLSLIEGSAECIPLEAASIDTAVMTWTGCSIPDVATALDEIRRVLKPGGRLLFVEHGRAPEPSVARWQDRLTPLWKRVAGGCHLNRKIDDLIIAAGFASWSGGESDERKLIVRGQAHLLEDLHALEDLERVRLLFDDLEAKRGVVDLLGRAEQAEGVRIFIGSENNLFSLSGSSTIVSPYRDGSGRIVGVLGVIGPTRLNYARIIPMVDYTSKLVSRLLAG